jgi:Serine/Threonine/Tyrosine Kinase found in polyvalent proteins
VPYDVAAILKKAFERFERGSPESAAHYVRRSTSPVQSGTKGDRKRRSQREALITWAARHRRILETSFLASFPYFGEGAEHRIHHDPSKALAIKATHPGSFGYSAYGEGVRATPLEYLERLCYSNLLFGDEIRILGVCMPQQVIQIIVSQPWIPASASGPTATEDEIDEYFANLQFRRVEINPGVPIYFNCDTELIVADAHPGNVLRYENRLFPIDVVIGKPGPEVLGRIRQALNIADAAASG